jgi:hypothetical protein
MSVSFERTFLVADPGTDTHPTNLWFVVLHPRDDLLQNQLAIWFPDEPIIHARIGPVLYRDPHYSFHRLISTDPRCALFAVLPRQLFSPDPRATTLYSFWHVVEEFLAFENQ